MDFKTEYEFKEIFKLKDMLDDAGIYYDFADESYQIGNTIYTYYHIWCYENDDIDPDNWFISIIQSFGSYGREQDKLEIMRIVN